jgi:predicted house-cleaning noncanonical NTP pyrophosphatase (MazG superfamily)
MDGELVREAIAKQLLKKDPESVVRLKDKTEIRSALAAKLTEKCQDLVEELVSAKINKKNILKESCDLREIIYTVLYHLKYGEDALQEICDDKYEEFGGFEDFYCKLNKVI